MTLQKSFSPCREFNSIEHLVLNFRFLSSRSPHSVEKIHKMWKNGSIFSNFEKFQIIESEKSKICIFFKNNKDDEPGIEYEMKLFIKNNMLVIDYLQYRRWDQTKNIINNILHECKILFNKKNIFSVGLEYRDKFFSKLTSFDINLLLKENKFTPIVFLESKKPVQLRTQVEYKIENMSLFQNSNVLGIDISNYPSEKEDEDKIYCELSTFIGTVIKDKINFTKYINTYINDHLDILHFESKNIFSSMLQDSIKKDIGL